jgi:hypothetical protein
VARITKAALADCRRALIEHAVGGPGAPSMSPGRSFGCWWPRQPATRTTPCISDYAGSCTVCSVSTDEQAGGGATWEGRQPFGPVADLLR